MLNILPGTPKRTKPAPDPAKIQPAQNHPIRHDAQRRGKTNFVKTQNNLLSKIPPTLCVKMKIKIEAEIQKDDKKGNNPNNKK